MLVVQEDQRCSGDHTDPSRLIGLGIAAVVAYCNATASAQLAAEHPTSGGTYVYGQERLGDWWGFLAGWGFAVGSTWRTRGEPVAGTRDGLPPAPEH